MKKKKQKARIGLIVRTTSFQFLKRDVPKDKQGKTFQRKIGKESYEVVTYQNHKKKIVTHMKIVNTEGDASSLMKKRYKEFEKNKLAHDIGGSIQHFNGRIITAVQGKIFVDGKATKSAHLYNVKRTGKKVDRQTIFENRLIQTIIDLRKMIVENETTPTGFTKKKRKAAKRKKQKARGKGKR